MSNVHGLFSRKRDEDDDDDDDENNRYVGGIGDHGGGRYACDKIPSFLFPGLNFI